MNRNQIPRRPSGSDNEARRFIDNHDLLFPARRPMPRYTPFVSSAAGWRWANPIELEDPPKRGFSKGEIIHIQKTHSIVTAGVKDAANPSGAAVTSCGGMWAALQNVPAPVTSGSDIIWNLPQDPMPEKTNWDDKTNFWVYLGEVGC